MIKYRSHFVLLVLSFLFFKESNPAFGQENIQQAIQTTWNDFIDHWQKQDAAGCADFFVEDGINIPPSFPANNGRKEVAQFYKTLFDQNQGSQYQHQIEAIEDLGDQLVERGTFTVDWVNNDGTKWRFEARSVTHWVQSDEGKWQIKTFIFNEAPKE